MNVIASTERVLTQIDHVRLTRLLRRAHAPQAETEVLQDLLDVSELVASPAVPSTVLTMYTQALLQDPAGGEPYPLTLCYPADAEPAQGFVSVLSPVGTSLLGLRVGQVAQWRLPGGQSGAARILSVLFQPEASGDYVT